MRQLFYLLMILNLLLILWTYQSQQQPEQLQTGNPAIGDLHIVSDDVIQHIKSDVDEGYARSASPDAVPAPLKHTSSRIIVTSINGYEVVLPSINSYPSVVRIIDQLQLSAIENVNSSSFMLKQHLPQGVQIEISPLRCIDTLQQLE